MAQTTLFPLQSNPYPLGVVAPTAGTPLRLTNYLTAVAGFTDVGLSQNQIVELFSIQALPGNTGNVYVLNSSAAADLTNYSNVLGILTAGSVFNSKAYTMGPLNFYNIWIDVGTTGA